MSDELNADRWQDLVDLHENLEESHAVLPMRISGVDGSQLEASPKAIEFAQALAFNAGWSGISDARRRHINLAA
jgi:hypothetical protein